MNLCMYRLGEKLRRISREHVPEGNKKATDQIGDDRVICSLLSLSFPPPSRDNQN